MTSDTSKKSNNFSDLSRNDEIIDSRVGFEYQVSAQPNKIDSKGNKWYLFRLFISPKGKFALSNINKVVYLLPSSFDPQNVASQNPQTQFAIELEALGEFYVKAIIVFNTGEKLKLMQYLPKGTISTDPSTISNDPAAYWTDFAMKQAQYYTSIGPELFKTSLGKDSPS